MTKQTKNPSIKEIKPPYLSLTALEKLFGLLSTRHLDTINTSYLEAQRFSKYDIGIIPSTLKFLNIIDDESKTTEIAKKLHLQGDPKKEALQSIVKTAYQKIFERIEKPYETPPQDLMNEFIAGYELSPRVASAAVPSFLWLCEEAGFRERSLVPRKRLANPKTEPKNNKLEKLTKKSIISEKNLPIITTKLDIIKEFVGNINLENVEVEKIKIVSGIVKELLDSVPDPISPETKTDSGEGTA